MHTQMRECVCIAYRGIRSKMRYVTYDEEQLPANDVRSRTTNSLKNKKKASVQKKERCRVVTEETGYRVFASAVTAATSALIGISSHCTD